MTPLVIRYPLDPTGVNPNNLVQGEIQTMVRRKVRAIATEYGAFFTESMKIVDTATNTELVRGVQYVAVELYEVPTAKYGKEVCAVILVTDETVSDQVSLQYQAVGGMFSNSATAITQMFDNLNLDDRPVSWPSIIEKPSEYPPSHHLHDIGDVYGFEYVVHALERIRSAIELGDSIAHDKILSYIDNALAQFNAQIANNSQALANHIAAPDPHPQYAMDTDVAAVIDGAPVGLNTLRKIAASINNDLNYATTVNNALAAKAPTASPTFTGQVTLAEGAPNAPSLTFSNEAANDTGMYHLGDGSFGGGANGVPQFKVSPTGVDLFNNPTVPTQAPGTNSTRAASTAYTDAAVAVEVVNRNAAISAANSSLATKEDVANKATNFGTVNNTLYPTVQAVKAYADSLVVGLIDDRGVYNASSNTYPTAGGSGPGGAILKGDLWYVSVAGTLGGVAVNVGDSFRALVDGPGQAAGNWAQMESNLGYVPYNATNPAGYTANSTDAQLRDRSTHTGTQSVNTITGLGALATQNNVTALQIDTALSYTPAAREQDNTYGGRQFIPSGTLAGPSLAFSAENGSGMYRSGAGHVNFAVTGQGILDITTSGISVSGEVVASGNVRSTSDIRTKKDIVQIENALERIKRLTGVLYSVIVPEGQPELPRRTGLIAQDALKVLPEAVGADAEGMLSIAYGNMVGLVVEGLKELCDQVDAIRADVALLKAPA